MTPMQWLRRVLRDPDLSVGAKAMACVMQFHAHAADQEWFRLSAIDAGRDLGCSDRHAKRLIRALIECDLIEVHHDGRGGWQRENRYRLRDESVPRLRDESVPRLRDESVPIVVPAKGDRSVTPYYVVSTKGSSATARPAAAAASNGKGKSKKTETAPAPTFVGDGSDAEDSLVPKSVDKLALECPDCHARPGEACRGLTRGEGPRRGSDGLHMNRKLAAYASLTVTSTPNGKAQ